MASHLGTTSPRSTSLEIINHAEANSCKMRANVIFFSQSQTVWSDASIRTPQRLDKRATIQHFIVILEAKQERVTVNSTSTQAE